VHFWQWHVFLLPTREFLDCQLNVMFCEGLLQIVTTYETTNVQRISYPAYLQFEVTFSKEHAVTSNGIWFLRFTSYHRVSKQVDNWMKHLTLAHLCPPTQMTSKSTFYLYCTEGKMLHFKHSTHNGTQQPKVTNFCHHLAHYAFI
jgi:hypothetical protein